jgi:hypothetical protein
VFHLTQSPPSRETQRLLTLLAKTLQNLANNITFGKEEYMTTMNEFIEQQLPRVREYLFNLTVRQYCHFYLPVQIVTNHSTIKNKTIVEAVKMESLQKLYVHTKRNKAKILKNVGICSCFLLIFRKNGETTLK